MIDTIDYAKLATKVRSDYVTYLKIVWPFLSGGRAPLTPYELDAFCWAVGTEPGRDSRRFLFCHREFGKSTGITYAFPPFCWLSDPTCTIAAFTKSGTKATEALTATRGLLDQSPVLNHLKPPADGWNKDHSFAFHVNGATNRAVPSFKALGSTGMSTGGRVDRAILDDFETIENSMTREARQATAARIREIVRTARENALIILVGTYARDESCYQDLIDEGWEHRIYPILYPTDEERQLATNKAGYCYYAPCLLHWLDSGRDYLNRPTRPGGIVQPERWTPEYIARNHGGRVGEFRRHYMGIRRSGQTDEFQLRLSDLIVHPCTGPVAPMSILWGTESANKTTAIDSIQLDIPQGSDDCFRKPAFFDPQHAEFANPTVLALDPAGFGQDEMAWSIWSRLNGSYYNRALRGHKLKPDDSSDPARRTLTDTIEGKNSSILSDVVRFKVSSIWVEAQSGGHVIADRLRAILAARSIPCAVTCEHTTGQKELRILSAARPLTSEHRVVIDPSVAQDTEFQHQYTRITATRGSLDHDDRIEAWAKGLQLISDGDVAVPHAIHEANTLDRELDALSPSPSTPRWGDNLRKRY